VRAWEEGCMCVHGKRVVCGCGGGGEEGCMGRGGRVWGVGVSFVSHPFATVNDGIGSSQLGSHPVLPHTHPCPVFKSINGCMADIQ
jgi:hypothetical protein